MTEKRMSVHQVANLTGVTTRTLHYYDQIGLFKPSVVTEAKYRLYTEGDLCRLQEILFFREVGFSLKDIKQLLSSPSCNREEVLKKHIRILEAQRERINALIELVKAEIRGDSTHSFAAFSNSDIIKLQKQYREEVIERWGNTDSFREYEAKFPAHDITLQNKQLSAFYIFAQEIFGRLALYEDSSPACDEVQQIVQEWQQYISEHFYSCDKPMLAYLGNLYVTDERFSNLINRFGIGNLALFFQKAIEIYCKKQ